MNGFNKNYLSGVEQKKFCELWSTNNNLVIGAHVDPPWVNNERSAYAFEFGPRDFAAVEISTSWIFPPIGLKVLGGLTLGFAPNF